MKAKGIILKLTHLPKRLYMFSYGKIMFYKFGRHSLIFKPLRIEGSKNIKIGDYVQIRKYVWLASRPLTGTNSELNIGNGTIIGDFCHIYSTHKIVIAENVLFANFVYVSDNLHNFDDIDIPIIKQSIKQKNDVYIGEGSWIGEHVSIIGSSVGKHCVIGANSVVTHDIPDYSVAVGSPAKVIRTYDFSQNKWINI